MLFNFKSTKSYGGNVPDPCNDYSLTMSVYRKYVDKFKFHFRLSASVISWLL